MAKLVVKTPVVTVNGVDFSSRCSQATIETTFDGVDLTAFGSVYKETAQGLGDGTITLSVFQDFAAGSIDATMWPLSQSGATFPVTIKATNAAVSATNPRYDMTGVLLSYNPIDGKIGDAMTTDLKIPNGSQAGITRNIV